MKTSVDFRMTINPNERRRGSAFTLIELLFVSTIALLLSIIVPALKRIKRQAVVSVWLFNIRLFPNAWRTLSMDFNGYVLRSPNQVYYGLSLPYGVVCLQDDVENYRANGLGSGCVNSRNVQ